MIETIICLLIIDKSKFICLFNHSLISNINSTVFLAIITFFTIGIGYIFTIFYRVFPWFKLNYYEFLCLVRDKEIYNFDNISPTLLTKGKLDFKENGWIITSALWYERAESSNEIKGAKERSQSLANLLHSAAASMFGSIFTLLVVIIFTVTICKFSISLFWGNLLAIILILIHSVIFCGARKTMRLFTEFVLWNALKNDKNTRPFEKLI
ncbi:hypothetical protein JWG40_12160 [Leptospira sp. 201903074]|uniref:hypothetical protein n=1 Tax=Leptospira abararensis TaxID=2810036 RepID=UPI001966396E|nr:hypothetical protein [Leptospira abararensis]MBM9547777.1 hypothetical protein [Leptospira abararensis]